MQREKKSTKRFARGERMKLVVAAIIKHVDAETKRRNAFSAIIPIDDLRTAALSQFPVLEYVGAKEVLNALYVSPRFGEGTAWGKMKGVGKAFFFCREVRMALELASTGSNRKVRRHKLGTGARRIWETREKTANA